MESTHLWTLAIRNYGLEGTPITRKKMLELLLQECTDVSSCIREATEDVMYVEENLKKNKLPVTPVT